jgi:hypothetical protein
MEILALLGIWWVCVVAVLAVLFFFAPLAIWHNVASTKLETRRTAEVLEKILAEVRARLPAATAVADCPHCGKETRVNPTQNTPQVCEHCRQEIVVG